MIQIFLNKNSILGWQNPCNTIRQSKNYQPPRKSLAWSQRTGHWGLSCFNTLAENVKGMPISSVPDLKLEGISGSHRI